MVDEIILLEVKFKIDAKEWKIHSSKLIDLLTDEELGDMIGVIGHHIETRHNRSIKKIAKALRDQL